MRCTLPTEAIFTLSLIVTFEVFAIDIVYLIKKADSFSCPLNKLTNMQTKTDTLLRFEWTLLSVRAETVFDS